MTSISGSSPSPSTLYVNNQGDGNWRVGGTLGDLDGDGVVDGEALSGKEGKVVKDTELNHILAASGASHLVASGNTLMADGIDVTSPNGIAATDFGGPPTLPDVGGPRLGNVDMGTKLTWMQEMEDASLMWLAMSTMAEVSQRELRDAKQLRNAMQLSKIQGKQAEIKADEERIAAERESAKTKMIFGLIGAAASAGAGAAGAGLSGGGSAAAGGAMTGLSMTLGQAITTIGDYVDKAHGAGRVADDKQVEGKRWQMMQEMDDQAIDEAKGQYEEAKEQFKKALQIMTEHVERQSQVVQKITS